MTHILIDFTPDYALGHYSITFGTLTQYVSRAHTHTHTHTHTRPSMFQELISLQTCLQHKI